MDLDTIGSTSATALEPALTVLERLWRSVTMECASWVVVRAMTSFLNCLCSVMYNNMDDSLTMILSDT
jgi:cell division protein FtsX